MNKPIKVNALTWAKKAIGLHGCEKATLVKIADNIGDIVQGECYKSMPNIAEEHGISERALQYGLHGRLESKTSREIVKGLEARGILVAVGNKMGGGFQYNDNGKRCGFTTRWKINISVLLNYLSNANAKKLCEKLGWKVPPVPPPSTGEKANEGANEGAQTDASGCTNRVDEGANLEKSGCNSAHNLLIKAFPEKTSPEKALPKPVGGKTNSKTKPSGKKVVEINAAVFAMCGQTAASAQVMALLETHTAGDILGAFKAYCDAQHDDKDIRWAVKNFFKDGGGEAVILACQQKQAQDAKLATSVAASIETGVASRRADSDARAERIREEEKLAARLGDSPF